jgi:hypothetical protein
LFFTAYGPSFLSLVGSQALPEPYSTGWCATGLGRASVDFESCCFANRESETLEYFREREQFERFDEVDIEAGGLRFGSEVVEPGQRDRRDRADR